MDTSQITKRRRTRGSGAVYRHGDRWRGSYYAPDPQTRRPRRRYVSGRTEAEARRVLRQAIEAAHKDVQAAQSPALEWWVRRWLDNVALSRRPATVRSYRRAMTRVLEAFGAWPLTQIQPSDVERWQRHLSQTMKPSTVALYRRVFGICLQDARRERRVADNAAHLARAPRVAGTTRRRTLTATEARHLLAFARTDADSKIGLLVTLGLATGARVGELLGLQWSDADLDRAALRIERSLSRHGAGPTKSRRGQRIVGLPPLALDALRAAQPGHGPIFGISPAQAEHRWRQFRERAGYADLRFHDLRGSMATLALANGANPKMLADILGHDPAVLMRVYAGPMEQGREQIAALIGEALA